MLDTAVFSGAQAVPFAEQMLCQLPNSPVNSDSTMLAPLKCFFCHCLVHGYHILVNPQKLSHTRFFDYKSMEVIVLCLEDITGRDARVSFKARLVGRTEVSLNLKIQIPCFDHMNNILNI